MDPPARLCDHCGKPAVVQCVRCKAAFYCRRKCQKFHWSRGGHKPACIAAAAAFNTPANREQLWLAAFHGRAAAARDLVARGADANYPGHAELIRTLTSTLLRRGYSPSSPPTGSLFLPTHHTRSSQRALRASP